MRYGVTYSIPPDHFRGSVFIEYCLVAESCNSLAFAEYLPVIIKMHMNIKAFFTLDMEIKHKFIS